MREYITIEMIKRLLVICRMASFRMPNESEDLLQEALLYILKNKIEFENINSFVAYFSKTVNGKSIDMLRKFMNEKSAMADINNEEISQFSDDFSELMVVAEEIKNALGGDKDAKFVIESRMSGYSYGEIAESMKKRIDEVNAIKQRAIRKLQRAYGINMASR